MRTYICRTCTKPFPGRGKSRYCSDECRHGTDAGYNAGCKCDPCKAAHARNHKRLRCIPTPHVPALGTHRRIQALACLGWSTAELSRHLGKHRSYILKVTLRATVEHNTALMVAALYEQLSMTRSHSPLAGRTISAARRNGWAPPLAWDDIDNDAEPAANGDFNASRIETNEIDQVVVERVLAGQRVPYATRAERVEVVRRWRAAGWSLTELERLTGWKPDRYYTPGSDPFTSAPIGTIDTRTGDRQEVA